MNKLLFCFCSFFIAAHSLTAAPQSSPMLFGTMEPTSIEIHNRILAKVNGKAISVMDVMKKLDIIFHQQYPQYANSIPIKHQFYSANWRQVLQQLIDKELILADATEMKINVSSGDIRQEMDSLFGPNIMVTLDNMGMTFQDAWDIVSTDILLRRMLYARVNMRAFSKVHPKDLRKSYEKFCEENSRSDEWIYQVLSIRDESKEQSQQIANLAHHLLSNNECSMEELPEKLRELVELKKTTDISISEKYTHAEDKISPSYKTILKQLEIGKYSEPIIQQSRAKGGEVLRIFHLNQVVKGGAPELHEVENNLKQMLVGSLINAETDKYISKLRSHFDVRKETINEMIPEDFEPFTLN